MNYDHLPIVYKNPGREVRVLKFNPLWGGVAEIDDQVSQVYFDPKQYFIPCNLPMTPTGLIGKPVTIREGWVSRPWLSGASVVIVSNERRRQLSRSRPGGMYQFEFLGLPMLWFCMEHTVEGSEYVAKRRSP